MKTVIFLILLSTLAWVVGADAATQTIDYRLNLGPGAGPERGPIPLTFTLYADSLGGPPLWQESHSPVADRDGNVHLVLGSVNPLPPAVFAKSSCWLELRLGNRLFPNRRKVAIYQLPFAQTAADSARWNPVPPNRLPDGRIRVALLDFGPMAQQAPYHVAVSTEERLASFAWSGGTVRTRTDPVQSGGLYYCDYVEGYDASFTIRVHPQNATYRVTLTFGDKTSKRGSVAVFAGNGRVGSVPAIKAGESRQTTFDVTAKNGEIALRIVGSNCSPWAAVGLDLYGPPGSSTVDGVSGDKPIVFVPPTSKLGPARDPRDVLRNYCDFLICERLSDGGFSGVGSWYANAYPIRTLLAGSMILSEPAWRATAYECLDRFVKEQRSDGNWNSSYFGPSTCNLDPDPNSSANLADIGCMSLCLGLAAPLADKSRQSKYLESAIRYADRIVLPSQLPNGAFPNGLYRGTLHSHPYSVATATQTASLSVLGALTGNPRYKDAAARAALWLAKQVRQDGSVLFWPHDTDKTRVVPATSFGDLFYIVEALTWVERTAERDDVKAAARSALNTYLWGPQGAKAATKHGYWWNSQNLWSDGKMGGMLYILTEAQKWSKEPELEPWKKNAFAWLANTGLSRQIGVLAPLPSRTGLYGMTATGMAGIGIVNLINPEVFALRVISNGSSPSSDK